MIKRIYSYLELYRYRILARDGILSKIYYFIILLFYPLISTRFFLDGKLINHRNRDKETLGELIKLSQAEYPELKDKKRDLIICYLRYHIHPWEYVLYNFIGQTHKQRMQWLSDADRYMCCELTMGVEPYLCLKDKYSFYKLAKNYFKRDILPMNTDASLHEDLDKFIEKHDRIFVKPLSGSLGRDTTIIDCNQFSKGEINKKLADMPGAWLLEEAITQAEEMSSWNPSSWNPSSVNTIRIPSFRKGNATCIIQPFFRTGRKGQIVDNAGAGGILAVVNAKTGIVESNGFDEKHQSYERHPDSGIAYKGWKIPHYDELVKLTNEVHKSLPESFRYVAFDFALTNNGWDLIEANWGQMVGQIAAQKGIKQEFDYWLGIIKKCNVPGFIH